MIEEDYKDIEEENFCDQCSEPIEPGEFLCDDCKEEELETI